MVGGGRGRGGGRHQTARGFRRGGPALHHPPPDLLEAPSPGRRRGPGLGVVGRLGGGVRAAERRDRARVRLGERGRRPGQGHQRFTVQPAGRFLFFSSYQNESQE